MIIRFLPIFLLLLVSCGNVKNNSTEDNEVSDKTVVITLDAKLQKRHCGGMTPPKDYENGIKVIPFANATFYIKSGIKNLEDVSSITSFTTDENGKATVAIPEGEYCIVLADKIKDFDTFYKEHLKTEKFTKSKGDDCLKNWYEQCDASFNTNDTKSVSFMIKENCGYGVNPCLEYTGPPQP